MSGQRGAPNDPTSRRALLPLAIGANNVGPMIQAMLDSLGEREAAIMAMRFGLLDGQPKTLDEIGKLYGVTRERIRQIESRSMSRLRGQMPSSPLVVTDGGQVVDLVDVPRTGASRSGISPGGNLVLCPQCKQRQFLPDSELSTGGRLRKYCSNACRQAAYRARRATPGDPGGLTEAESGRARGPGDV